ncbi:hypoxanthine phosphoribosyltransferase [Magnetococcus marinus MC-1]|uniref:Hypoxanthine phosphoribosyltransferase n=1 Tax=Magnetococcus marinus (strain ATCC BAA-1437 / JCM 17883 / MC-1) TaxID=156889 RepID=A0L5E3_MAGMM|nr:hypoxanthine phosphoribosyltransferase [Magnetococcus marinus MC-1]
MTQNAEAKANLDHLEPFIDRAHIALRVAELGVQIRGDMVGKDPVFLVVLKGGFVFAADLMRALDHTVPVAFTNARPCAHLPIFSREDEDLLRGKDIWVVDALLDQGHSAMRLMQGLQPLQPTSIQFAVLLHKTVERAEKIPVRYVGFEVPDTRLVGYGLDENQQFRGMRNLYAWWPYAQAIRADEPEEFL